LIPYKRLTADSGFVDAIAATRSPGAGSGKASNSVAETATLALMHLSTRSAVSVARNAASISTGTAGRAEVGKTMFR
jgi:hypothetical protein